MVPSLLGGAKMGPVEFPGSHLPEPANSSAAAFKNSIQLVTFDLSARRYALRLSAIGRIVRVVEIIPLPKAPEIILGVINVQGRVVPVVNVCKRFGLPERAISLTDHLMIAHTGRRAVALVTDAVSGVVEYSEDKVTSAEKILPGLEYVEGVMKFHDGLIFIHNLDTFLSFEEEQALEQAITTSTCQGQ